MAPVLATRKTPKKAQGNPFPNHLTVAEAAAELGVTSRQAIHDAIARGRLRASRLGSIVVVERPSLESYRKSRKRTGRPRKD